MTLRQSGASHTDCEQAFYDESYENRHISIVPFITTLLSKEQKHKINHVHQKQDFFERHKQPSKNVEAFLSDGLALRRPVVLMLQCFKLNLREG